MEFDIKYAEELITKENYEEAEKILGKLWSESNKDDMYLLSRYGQVLRKNSKQIEYIKICREKVKNKSMSSNKYIVSTLCWCIYDVYISGFTNTDENENEFNEFIKRAEYIVRNSSQEKADRCFINPYVLTVRKVIKVYKNKGTNYRKILKWVDFLEPESLPEEVFSFTDSNGIEREQASLKEFYYQIRAMALEKLEMYDECIKCCNKAFEEINYFHYKNQIWLRERMLYSRCMSSESVDESKKNIEEYKNFAFNKKLWYVYHKISKYYYRNNELDEALYWGAKALVTDYNGDNMNKLILDLAFIYDNKGENKIAKIFFQACAYYRNLNNWILPEELKYKILENDIDINELPNIKEMKSICLNYVRQREEKNIKYGQIKKLFLDKGFGFIQSQENQDIYFRTNNLKQKINLRIGLKVKFEVAEDKQGRKVAIKIKEVDRDGRSTY